MTLSAREVFDRHVSAVAAGDIEAIMATYSRDAVLADTDHIGRGHEYVRAVHQQLLEAAADLHAVTQVYESGKVIFVSWTSTDGKGSSLVGTNTFVIDEGLISLNSAFKARDPRNATT